MEEDIEYLKILTKPPLREEWDFAYKLDKKTAQAIENLIAAYKEQKCKADIQDVTIKNMKDFMEQLEKENSELKATYRKTAAHFNETGKEELAEYMLAQIEDIPVWVAD